MKAKIVIQLWVKISDMVKKKQEKTDEEKKKYYMEMIKFFGLERLPNPEHYPNSFLYYQKLYDFYQTRKKKSTAVIKSEQKN